MSVNKEKVLATAALARLDLRQTPGGEASAEEAEATLDKIAAQMESIVGYMDILGHADTEGVEPLYSPLAEAAPPRDDLAVKRLEVEEVLSNAPRRQGRFFSVPPVI